MRNKSNRILFAVSLIMFLGVVIAYAEGKRQEKRISITLTEAEWNVVLQGVNELPMKIGLPVYSSIMQQAQMQLQVQQQKSKIDTTKKKP